MRARPKGGEMGLDGFRLWVWNIGAKLFLVELGLERLAILMTQNKNQIKRTQIKLKIKQKKKEIK